MKDLQQIIKQAKEWRNNEIMTRNWSIEGQPSIDALVIAGAILEVGKRLMPGGTREAQEWNKKAQSYHDIV